MGWDRVSALVSNWGQRRSLPELGESSAFSGVIWITVGTVMGAECLINLILISPYTPKKPDVSATSEAPLGD
jgi:hypothetical protein